MWSVTKNKCLKTFAADDLIQCMLKISSQKIAAGLDEGVILVWCVKTTQELLRIQAYYKPVWHLDNLWENTIVSF